VQLKSGDMYIGDLMSRNYDYLFVDKKITILCRWKVKVLRFCFYWFIFYSVQLGYFGY